MKIIKKLLPALLSVMMFFILTGCNDVRIYKANAVKVITLELKKYTVVEMRHWSHSYYIDVRDGSIIQIKDSRIISTKTIWEDYEL